MATIYGDYSRDKIGWFFGLSGWQLATLAAAVMPLFWAIQHGAWLSAVLFAGLWVLPAVFPDHRTEMHKHHTSDSTARLYFQIV